jgi:hypothetical protein
MPDREKVIKDLEFCVNGHYKVELSLATKILALLKEQEAVVPKYNARTNWYECGACHYSMTSGMHCKGELIPAYKVGFCAKCGKAVRWK